MKAGLKHSIRAVLAAALAAVCILLSLRAGNARAVLTCNAIDIRMKDSLGFVEPEGVRRFVDKEFGTLIGQRIDSLPLALVEERVTARGAVKSCEAWTDSRGTLHLDISQRCPVLRFAGAGQGFYVDDRGFIFPLHKSYTADVTVVEGRIPIEDGDRRIGEAATEEERRWIASMLELENYISRSRQWRGQAHGIRVAGNGDISLKFDGCPETFIIGTPDRLDEKFGRISLYLSRIRPFKDGYRRVNVKYNKQIICRKDI